MEPAYELLLNSRCVALLYVHTGVQQALQLDMLRRITICWSEWHNKS